ncbi:DNA polymerase epsilon subunit 2 [Sparganum proliferum]
MFRSVLGWIHLKTIGFEMDQDKQECLMGQDTAVIETAAFSIKEVRRSLIQIKPGKYPGPDGILAPIFKRTLTELRKPPITLLLAGTLQDIKRALKLNGLLLAPDASTYVVDSLKHLEPTIREKTIQKFVDAVLERNLEIDNISKTVCEDIFREWQSESTNSQEFLFINDAFQVPRFKYCKYSRKFLPLQDSTNDVRSLLPNSPAMKAFLYAHRYEMVYQRVIRNPIFASSNDSNAGTNGSSAGFKLQPIEFLLALGAKEDSVVVLGALTQLKNGQWYLEDPTNLVKLDLSAATFHQGLFPEGAIVLAEGSFDDDVFKVTGIGLPPVEEPHLTRRYFSVPNPFGGSIVDGPAAAADTNMIRLLQTPQRGYASLYHVLDT